MKKDYKYIKCHICYGKGCSYCYNMGMISKERGNVKVIDKYWKEWYKKHDINGGNI